MARTMVELTGSPRQVAWAADIREGYADQIAEIPTDTEHEPGIERLLSQADASWWIERRGAPLHILTAECMPLAVAYVVAGDDLRKAGTGLSGAGLIARIPDGADALAADLAMHGWRRCADGRRWALALTDRPYFERVIEPAAAEIARLAAHHGVRPLNANAYGGSATWTKVASKAAGLRAEIPSGTLPV